VLFTSTPGFHVDTKIAGMMKDSNPKLKVAFVGPPVTTEPEKTLRGSTAIDFVVRREFDRQIVDYANGAPLEDLPGVSFRKNGSIVNNPEGPAIEDLDALPWVTRVYKRDLDIRRYNVPFLLHPFRGHVHVTRMPGTVHLLPVAADPLGHRWRLRSSDDVANEVRFAIEQFPNIKEVFFDDDTFNYRKERTIEVARKLQPLNVTWSCTSRVTTDYETLKAMKEAGCRLLIVGYESGDPQILKNIKEGRHRGHGPALHGELQETRPAGSRRLHYRAAGARRARASAGPSISQNGWTRKPSRFPSRIRIRGPSSTTTSRRTTSSPSIP